MKILLRSGRGIAPRAEKYKNLKSGESHALCKRAKENLREQRLEREKAYLYKSF